MNVVKKHSGGAITSSGLLAAFALGAFAITPAGATSAQVKKAQESVVEAVPNSTSRTTPHLFVSTPAIPPPGWLYAWPKFPTLIGLDDNDWISVRSWTVHATSATARGSLDSNLYCANKPAASCPTKAVATIELTASHPKTCTVHYEIEASGDHESTRVLVYGNLSYVSSTTHRRVSLKSPCR